MYIISAVLKKELYTVAVYDKEYNLLFKKESAPADPAELCLEAVAESGKAISDVDYAGVAADRSLGDPNAIAAAMAKELGVPCYGTYVMNARALGEAYGAGDLLDLFLLSINDTVDCGIVIDKKAFSGSYHPGSNVAHMVINFGGYECTCGRKGCFEAYAGNSGLRRIAAEAGVEGADSITHAALFNMTTPEAECAKKRYIEYLANGITNIINLFQPNELVLEGPFTKIGSRFEEPFTEIVLREQYTHGMPDKCNIRFSSNGSETALIGAALLGR